MALVMAIPFRLLLAISADHIMAVSAKPEQRLDTIMDGDKLCHICLRLHVEL